MSRFQKIKTKLYCDMAEGKFDEDKLYLIELIDSLSNASCKFGQNSCYDRIDKMREELKLEGFYFDNICEEDVCTACRLKKQVS